MRVTSYAGDWQNSANAGNVYTANSNPNLDVLAGYLTPKFTGNNYFMTSGSYNKKLFFGVGATGSYTWIGLLKLDSVNTAASNTIEAQYRLSTNGNHCARVSVQDYSGTLKIEGWFRDNSGNISAVGAPITSLADTWKIVAITFDTTTGTATMYIDGNTFTNTNNACDMSASVELTNTGYGGLGCFPYNSAPMTGSYLYGSIAERILFGEVMSTDTINKIAKYLMNKYNDQTLWTNV